jgi:hypothetical protein
MSSELIKGITLPSRKFPHDVGLGIRLYQDRIEFDLEPIGSSDPIESYSQEIDVEELSLIRDWLEEFESANFPCPGLFGEWNKDTLINAIEALKQEQEEKEEECQQN